MLRQEDVELYLTEALSQAYNVNVTSVVPFVGDARTVLKNLSPGRVGFFGELIMNRFAMTRAFQVSGHYVYRTRFRNRIMNDMKYDDTVPLNGNSEPYRFAFALFDDFIAQPELGDLGSPLPWIEQAGASYVGQSVDYPLFSFVGYRFTIN